MSSVEGEFPNIDRLAALPDDQIDFSDTPELRAEFFDTAKLRLPKEQSTTEPRKPKKLSD